MANHTHTMPATKFGRLAAQDPRLVLDMRNGREPRGATEARIQGFIAGFEAARHHRKGEKTHAR